MKKRLIENIDAYSDLLINLSKKIWSNPELAFEETFAADITKETLKNNGFKIVEIEGLPTAFYAEIGSGSPVVGLLGEYDALPGLSQQVSAKKSPEIDGGPGHGCGHNVMGVAAIGACLGLKKLVDSGMINGTIRFYACPAEEVLSGKTLMQTQGAFDGTDVAIAWHPFAFNGVYGNNTNALLSVEFDFKGIASHAGATPELGRSALDAVEIMNVATNYLREHIIKECRIHYVTTNGGLAPNIVPEDASVWYYIRAEKKEQVYSIFDRIIKCAEGAAMATETTVTHRIKADCYDTAPNQVLEELIDKNMRELGDIPFTQKEFDFGKSLIDTVPKEWYENDLKIYDLDSGTILHNGASIGIYGRGVTDLASTDVGDVSHLMPTASFALAGVPVGIPFHSWQATASFGSSIADVIVVHAAKVFAATTYDLLTTGDEVIAKAKEEFKANIAPYKTKLSGPCE